LHFEELKTDATLVAALKGGAVGLTKCGKGSKIQLLIEGGGLPLGTLVEEAAQAETTLVQQL
jgi:hypothetical protein